MAWQVKVLATNLRASSSFWTYIKKMRGENWPHKVVFSPPNMCCNTSISCIHTHACTHTHNTNINKKRGSNVTNGTATGLIWRCTMALVSVNCSRLRTAKTGKDCLFDFLLYPYAKTRIHNNTWCFTNVCCLYEWLHQDTWATVN